MKFVYIGIDVACAADKRLPLCVVSEGQPLTPLIIPKHLTALIPRGLGNREVTAALPFQAAAIGVAEAIGRIKDEMEWKVARVAIDAPSAPPKTGSRASENELSRCGLSSFRTPPVTGWTEIRDKCATHLRVGRSVAALPHANKIWMLFGFELFAALRQKLDVEIIEVYPFAIVRALLPACEHKSTEQGHRDQLEAVAARTGWDAGQLEASLKVAVPGSRHDRLDAFMAAWVATLGKDQRRAYGDPSDPDDAIWVPM